MKLKYIIVFTAILLSCNLTQAQEASVEKSIWGIQVGVPPLAVYNESRLTNSIALRSEINFGLSFQTSSYTSTQYSFYPNLILEPRYYYNLNHRQGKNKTIEGNSGNYVSLNLGYKSGIGFKSEYAEIYPAFNLIPMYGMRRNINAHFNYEFAFGIGYSWEFVEYDYYSVYDSSGPYNYKETIGDVAYGVRISIGYTF